MLLVRTHVRTRCPASANPHGAWEVCDVPACRTELRFETQPNPPPTRDVVARGDWVEWRVLGADHIRLALWLAGDRRVFLCRIQCPPATGPVRSVVVLQAMLLSFSPVLGIQTTPDGEISTSLG